MPQTKIKHYLSGSYLIARKEEKMTTAIRINTNHATIEICTKAFAEKAQRYGTVEYKKLQAVRKDYPNYTVVLNARSNKTKINRKGLNTNFMKKYATTFPKEVVDALGNKRSALEVLAELIDDEEVHFSTIKSWFIEIYPDATKISYKAA